MHHQNRSLFLDEGETILVIDWTVNKLIKCVKIIARHLSSAV